MNLHINIEGDIRKLAVVWCISVGPWAATQAVRFYRR